MKEVIKSLQNPKIKQAVKLRQATKRKKEDLIIIEGLPELILAMAADIEISTLFYCPNYTTGKKVPSAISDKAIVEVTPAVFKKAAYREHPDGFIAIAKPKILTLPELKLSKNPLLIILESVEKPGNLGAILRSADAAGVDAVIICDPKTDIFNPNVIRASIGAVFTNQVVACSTGEALDWLKQNKIISMAATPQANKLYTDYSFREPTAIVIGTEHEGLSEKWLKAADEKIKIPMRGKIDSLNASVSTGIILFEAVRQRREKEEIK